MYYFNTASYDQSIIC